MHFYAGRLPRSILHVEAVKVCILLFDCCPHLHSELVTSIATTIHIQLLMGPEHFHSFGDARRPASATPSVPKRGLGEIMLLSGKPTRKRSRTVFSWEVAAESLPGWRSVSWSYTSKTGDFELCCHSFLRARMFDESCRMKSWCSDVFPAFLGLCASLVSPACTQASIDAPRRHSGRAMQHKSNLCPSSRWSLTKVYRQRSTIGRKSAKVMVEVEGPSEERACLSLCPSREPAVLKKLPLHLPSPASNLLSNNVSLSCLLLEGAALCPSVHFSDWLLPGSNVSAKEMDRTGVSAKDSIHPSL